MLDWLLLNLILTALKDDFSVERVAQELRNQWPDHDLKHKDQSGRSSAWTVDAALEDDEEVSMVDRQGPDLNYLASTGLNEEGSWRRPNRTLKKPWPDGSGPQDTP